MKKSNDYFPDHDISIGDNYYQVDNNNQMQEVIQEEEEK
jgi:hypothetical protein